MKVLSIVIATYKREKYLITCLKNIIDSFADDCSINEIEIIVINNDPGVDIYALISSSCVLQNICFHVINNKINLGMDSSQLKGIMMASGKYILLGSDRYSYNIDFIRVVKYLNINNPEVLIFSDLFRRFFGEASNLTLSYKDEWLMNELPTTHSDESSFRINNDSVDLKNLINKGLIHKFSDVIFRKKDSSYYVQFDPFKGTFMLGIAILLDSIIKSCIINIFRVNYNTNSVISVGDGVTHIRHDYNKVVLGNIMIQEKNDDFFSLRHVNLNQFSALLGLKRGVLSGSIVMDVQLNKKTAFDLFLKSFKDTSLIDKISFVFLFLLESKFYANLFNITHKLYRALR